MTKIKFSDGIEVDTSGEYRTLKLPDGWYVVGHGTLTPCANETEAIKLRDAKKAAPKPRATDLH